MCQLPPDLHSALSDQNIIQFSTNQNINLNILSSLIRSSWNWLDTISLVFSRQLRLFSHPTQTGWDHETFVIYRMSIRSKSVCNCVNQNNIRANCCPCNKRIKHGWEVLSVSCPQPSCCPCLSTRFPLGEGGYLAMKQCIIQQMLSSLGDSTFIDHIYISQLDCSYIENLVLINLLSS